MSTPISHRPQLFYPVPFSPRHVSNSPAQRAGSSPRIYASLELNSPWNSQYRPPALPLSPAPSRPGSLVVSSSDTDYHSTPDGQPFISHSNQMRVEQQPSASPSNDATSSSFEQVESHIGPSRATTRGQRRANERHISSVSEFPISNSEDYDSSSDRSRYMNSPTMSSRSRSPPCAPEPERSSAQREPLTMSMNNTSSQPISYPSTPDSNPTHSPYSFRPQRLRSDSSAGSPALPVPRSTSPALSTMTSASSNSGSNRLGFPIPQPSTEILTADPHPRQKARKQRLFNIDRKAICVYHTDNPTARQEDIAVRYGVERSTISKILKHKMRWLNVPDDEEMRVAKHRPSKFPEIEEQMVKWLESTHSQLTDNVLRVKAKTVARDLRIPEDKFKASAGWVENFKHRHGIRGGAWIGDGKNFHTARALGGHLVPRLHHQQQQTFSPSPAPAELYEDSMHQVAHQHSIEEDSSSHQREERHLPMRLAVRHGWPDSPRPVDLGSDSMLIDQAERTRSYEHLHHSEPSPPSSHHEPPAVEQQHVYSAPVEQHIHDPAAEPFTTIAHHIPAMEHSIEQNIHPQSIEHSHVVVMEQELQQIIPDDDAKLPSIHERPFQEGPTIFAEGYMTVPTIPDNRPPTLEEAERHLDKALLFFDTHGRGILSVEERKNLQIIKCALFQAASLGNWNRS